MCNREEQINLYRTIDAILKEFLLIGRGENSDRIARLLDIPRIFNLPLYLLTKERRVMELQGNRKVVKREKNDKTGKM